MMRPERKAESMINCHLNTRSLPHSGPRIMVQVAYIHDAASVVRKKCTRQG